MKVNFYISASILLLVFSSCAVQKKVSSPYQPIINQIETAPANQQHQVGFVLRELGGDHDLVSINADHYFTPASNTKLFTFYTALNMLGDSVPTFQYIIKKDSLIIWPMADASFLHPDFKSQKAFDFLKNTDKTICLVNGRYKGEKFGAGWNWDDYNDDYQAEITDFPIYGNTFKASTEGGKLKLSPDLVAMYMTDIQINPHLKSIKRKVDSNNMDVPQNIPVNLHQTIPLFLNDGIIENLLTDTLLATGLVTKPVESISWRPVPANAKVFYSIKTDSLYQKMLQNSDNFMAEELLLNCAAHQNLTMNTDSMIHYAEINYLTDLPDKIQWKDASGLSRLNLVTPRDLTALLEKIYTKVDNQQQLFSLLPNGGKSGTIKNMFKNGEAPFVFAKSGSLSNNYNLSGYLIGKSGKKYVFSLMNNNYVQPSASIRAEVENLLTFIHNNY